jgi:hypothetical protein
MEGREGKCGVSRRSKPTFEIILPPPLLSRSQRSESILALESDNVWLLRVYHWSNLGEVHPKPPSQDSQDGQGNRDGC